MGRSSSSGSNRIAEQQERREAERLATIQQGMGAVNSIFDSPGRNDEINEVLAARRGLYFDELGRQKGDADRQLKFALARSGLAGSRQSVDNARLLGEQHQRATVDAENLAQNEANQLRMSDEDARADLIRLVQSGADVTTASNAATARMQQNLSGARTSGNVSALGDVFGSFSDLYKRSRERAGERAAQGDLRTMYNTAGQFGWGNSSQQGGW